MHEKYFDEKYTFISADFTYAFAIADQKLLFCSFRINKPLLAMQNLAG
jgi:hypothetical protein